MSITLRLIIGGTVCALFAVTFALFAFQTQSTSLGLVTDLYEDSVRPLERLHAAKSRTDALRARLAATFEAQPGADRPVMSEEEKIAFANAIRLIKGDLSVVLDAGLSDRAIGAATRLRYPLSRMAASEGNLSQRAALRELAELSSAIDLARDTVERDLLAYRDTAAAELDVGYWRTLAAIASVVVALATFTALMVRSLSGAIAYVGRVAKRIGSAEAMEPIVARGPREIRDLLSALSQMQRRWESTAATMSMRTDVLSGQLAEQQDQLSAALNNMTQALCMLDGEKKLVVCNEVFQYYFGPQALGTSARVFLRDPRLVSPLPRNETSTVLMETERGEIMEVKRRGMTGRGLLLTFEDITERQRIAEQLEHLAGHDSLTDLPNRHRFSEEIDTVLGRRRDDAMASVLDLRSFKSINDTYGHPIGDEVLIETGERLVRATGPKATVARLGGDEFGILVPGVRTPERAEELTRQILATIEEPYDIDGRRIAVGASVGVSLVRANDTDTSSDIVLQDCDLALYQAKEAARSSFQFFQPTMRQRLRDRREMELDLKVAVERDQLQLFYQPFVDTNEKRVSGFEALLRWRHPEKGMISPGLFVPLAEETGLIDEIGLWCLRTACREAAGWPGDMTISVNLSPLQFRSPTLVADVDAALRDSGLAPHRLQIEVTESLFLDESGNILQILEAFRARGLTISMDDFGTGYSSLGYLSRFPFDKIKIDQSFVRDLSRSENMAIVRSVIGLSRSLRMKVMAEGIETHDQLQLLYDEGCREMQGYFFSKPRPAEELALMIAEITKRWSSDLAITRAEPAEAAA